MGFVVAPKKLFTAALMVVIWVAVLPLVSSSSSSSAVTYKVGDDDVIGWSSSKRIFHVGDTIHFEYDSNKYQHVLQVTPTAYQLCDTTSPIAVFATENDSITFNNTGYYCFILGPGGCVQEQMLDIYIQPEEDHDDVSAAAPTLAQAAVSPSSSSSSLSSAAAAMAASSEPTPSPDDNFDDLTQYILLGAWLFFSVAIVLLASQ